MTLFQFLETFSAQGCGGISGLFRFTTGRALAYQSLEMAMVFLKRLVLFVETVAVDDFPNIKISSSVSIQSFMWPYNCFRILKYSDHEII